MSNPASGRSLLADVSGAKAPSTLVQVTLIVESGEAPAAAQLKSRLKQEGFAARVQPVLPQQSLPNRAAGERLSQWRSLLTRRLILTPGEVAHYLCHFRVIKKAFAQGVTHLCVLQEGAQLEVGMGKVLHEISRLPEAFHLVCLGGQAKSARKPLKKLHGQFQLTRLGDGSIAANGYVLNREGMRRVLEYGNVISQPLDTFLANGFLYGINGYGLVPGVTQSESLSISDTEVTDRDARPWVLAAHLATRGYRRFRRTVTQLGQVSEIFSARNTGNKSR